MAIKPAASVAMIAIATTTSTSDEPSSDRRTR
jgi:hypothetical protein